MDKSGPVRFECIIPILNVKSLMDSIRYYRNMLGFHVDWGDGEDSLMASVSRDQNSIMLCQGSQGMAGTWIWIGVENIEPLFVEYREKGVKFRETPTNYPWAYEMRIEDPDGHILRFGSDPKPNK
ncbi:MAG TPA: glyoxalase superfamily protein [Acidobacteriota bacterium]|nr:glyoxalase superfamily protein [Acidobacteriota bacterium]